MDLLIDSYGTFIGASGDRITISTPAQRTKANGLKSNRGHKKATRKERIGKEYPIRRIDKIAILRPSSISMHAVQLALEHDVDIVYLGAFGKPVGRIFSSDPRGIATLRKAQLRVSSDPLKSFVFARTFVLGKAQNQIELMKELSKTHNAKNEREIAQAEILISSTKHLLPSERAREELLGFEGAVAERYWHSMRPLFTFPGRMPEARDKFNSALNYGYGILYNEIERACLYSGLDPYLGLYHSERYGKPALVLDLIEEFRVPLVDSVIIPLFIKKELGLRDDFEKIGAREYRLSPQGKSKVVSAVLGRLAETATHRRAKRTFKTIISYQAELLGRIFMEKEHHYLPVVYKTT
jgi:CRISP-associated protein Cas1